MEKRLTVRGADDKVFDIDLDLPTQCPICHRHVIPTYSGGRGNTNEGTIGLLLQCTNRECDEPFIAVYRFQSYSRSYELAKLAPRVTAPPNVPDSVAKVSPTFVLVYKQALAAEGHSLDQLVGVGLRKALEFLVKDLAKRCNPADAPTIEAMMLGPCITKFIPDPNVQTCAKRAAWLGNDETHYVRKWESKDIADLKTLIRLTVNWTENFLLTEQYTNDMPD